MAETKGTKKPECGDLIEIFRGAYQHWAVYIGDGYVVHLVNPNSCSKSQGTIQNRFLRGKVMKEKLTDVVGNSRWKINNKLDRTYKPRPAEQIVKDALLMVGKSVYYSVYGWNCEHFATKLRYGKGMSFQVLKTTALIGVTAVVSVAAAPIVTFPVAFVGGVFTIWNKLHNAHQSSSVSFSF